VRAAARTGDDLLQRVLRTDRGAARLGEVALVPRVNPALAEGDRCFFLPLLDENALPHIALGVAYPFTVRRSGSRAVNHSILHLDLPLAATATMEDKPAPSAGHRAGDGH
jgi:aminopeptidase